MQIAGRSKRRGALAPITHGGQDDHRDQPIRVGVSLADQCLPVRIQQDEIEDEQPGRPLDEDGQSLRPARGAQDLVAGGSERLDEQLSRRVVVLHDEFW